MLSNYIFDDVALSNIPNTAGLHMSATIFGKHKVLLSIITYLNDKLLIYFFFYISLYM